MDKIAKCKEQIYKEAMALSKADYLAVKNNMLGRAAGWNGYRTADWKSLDKLFEQKNTTSKQALNLYRTLKDSVPQGKSLELKNSLNKHLFFNGPVEKNITEFAINHQRNILNKGKLSDLDFRKLNRLSRMKQPKDSYSAFSNIIATNPANISATSHEMGHAASVKRPAKENTENFLLHGFHNAQDAYDGYGKKDSAEFVHYVKNAYRDGNKKSKQIGRRLIGAWHEALKNNNKQYLEELRANAKSYNSINKHLGKNVADKTLDANLGSIMSYTYDNPGDKAEKLWNEVVMSPTYVKNKKIDYKAVYKGERGSSAITQRNKKMEETFKKK